MRVRVRTLVGLAAIPVALPVAWRAASAPVPPPDGDAAERAALEARAGLVVAALIASRAAEVPAIATRPPVDVLFGLDVAHEARAQLRRPAPGFRDDCSGYVSAVFTAVGVPMDGRVASLWDLAVDHDALHWEEVPAVGDLVFFDDTFDRDRDGRLDDDLSHIGIVVDVEPDGTVVFAHAGLSSGRGLGRMNLAEPARREGPDGATWNTVIRTPRPWDPPGTGYRAGELWAAFATVSPELDWLGFSEG